MTNARTSLRGQKQAVLVVATVCSALIGILAILLSGGPSLPIARVLTIFCISLLVLAWCYFDSLERHQPLPSRFRVVILIFGLFALFIYLFQSRGFTKGLRSTGLALVLCAGMLLVMLTSALGTVLIFDMD